MCPKVVMEAAGNPRLCKLAQMAKFNKSNSL